jgi:hypothetical protein
LSILFDISLFGDGWMHLLLWNHQAKFTIFPLHLERTPNSYWLEWIHAPNLNISLIELIQVSIILNRIGSSKHMQFKLLLYISSMHILCIAKDVDQRKIKRAKLLVMQLLEVSLLKQFEWSQLN